MSAIPHATDSSGMKVRFSVEAAIEGVEAENGRGDFGRAGLALDPDRPHQNVAGKAVGEARRDEANEQADAGTCASCNGSRRVAAAQTARCG